MNLARRVGKDAHPTKSGARVFVCSVSCFLVVEEQKMVVNDESQRVVRRDWLRGNRRY